MCLGRFAKGKYRDINKKHKYLMPHGKSYIFNGAV